MYAKYLLSELEAELLKIYIHHFQVIHLTFLLAGKVQCFLVSAASIKMLITITRNPLFVKLDRVPWLFATTWETQLMLQQMTSDLNKNYDKIWEPVKALNNVRNNAAYKDASPCRLWSDRVQHLSCTRQNASQQHSHFWLQESLWQTALWPRNPLLIVAKWSFVAPAGFRHLILIVIEL